MAASNIKTTTALADAFSMLSILTEYPTQELATAISTGDLAQDVASICEEAGICGDEAMSLLSELSGKNGDEVLAGMRREYTRLFNHPENPAIPLYEGQFLFQRSQSTGWRLAKSVDSEVASSLQPRLFVNPASLDAIREYRKAGLKQLEERSIPADAMPVEMAFMAQLLIKLAEGYLKDDEDLQSEMLHALKEFNRYHLSKWMGDFYYACATESTHAAYRALGSFGLQILESVEAQKILS